MSTGIRREVVETYKRYEIIKFTSPAKDVIYNGVYPGFDAPQLITCVGDSVEEVRAKIDWVYARIRQLEIYHRNGCKIRK